MRSCSGISGKTSTRTSQTLTWRQSTWCTWLSTTFKYKTSWLACPWSKSFKKERAQLKNQQKYSIFSSNASCSFSWTLHSKTASILLLPAFAPRAYNGHPMARTNTSNTTSRSFEQSLTATPSPTSHTTNSSLASSPTLLTAATSWLTIRNIPVMRSSTWWDSSSKSSTQETLTTTIPFKN